MKVEASSYDTVTWNPQPFDPGKMFYRLSNIAKTQVGERKEILLKAPCRIDVGLIDFSALKFTDENDYKAGEMSFACNAYTRAHVKLTENQEMDINSSRPLIVKHIALLLKQSTDYQGGFEIKTQSHPYQHIGFGSSAVMSEIIGIGINRLLGEPLSTRDLRKLIAHNFGEEGDSDKTKLFPGATTGGSFNTITNGGFVITSTETEMIFRSKIPEDTRFIVGTPKVEVKGPEASETDVNSMSWERHNERINAAKTCLWIVTEIMPAAVQGNLAKMGDAFYNYTLLGGKAMLMLFYRCDLAGTLFELKEAGLEGGWMTSAGPSLVTFTQDRVKEEKAINIFKRRGFGIVQLSPDNEGIKEE